MVNLSAVNTRKPTQLLQEGTLCGTSLEIDVTSVTEHVHSRAATIYRAQSDKNGEVALKVVFAPDVREPHNIRKEIRLLSQLGNTNVRVAYLLFVVEVFRLDPASAFFRADLPTSERILH